MRAKREHEEEEARMRGRVGVALGLQDVVERQHAELARLHSAHRAQRAQHAQRRGNAAGAPRQDQATDGLGLALAAQHAELAQLRSQMAQLRQELLSAARSSAAVAAADQVPHGCNALPDTRIALFRQSGLDAGERQMHSQVFWATAAHGTAH